MNINEMFLPYTQSYFYNYPYEYDYDYYNWEDSISRQPVSDGQRVRHPGRPEIYLMDKGKRRLIVDANVYNGIFKDWQRIVDVNLQSIPLGPPIVQGTILFKHQDRDMVYLYDREDGQRWVKRWITSPRAMSRYQFDWNKIRVLYHSFNPPDGSNIN